VLGLHGAPVEVVELNEVERPIQVPWR